jgi:dihydroorotate dehydrogenase
LLGVNIGKNKDSKELFADYLKLLDKFYPFAGYITLNISSPNTPGLRNLHAHSILKEMLACITERVKELQVKYRKHTPVLLKIAPDLSDHNLEEISDIILKYQIEGLIVSNTTIERPSDLKSRYRNEAGGLSGKPLFAPSTLVLQKLYRLTQGKVLLIGCGGVFSGADAYAKIISGATLIQIYTALIYEGFGVINKINQELNQLLEYDGYRSITEAVGVGVK